MGNSFRVRVGYWKHYPSQKSTLRGNNPNFITTGFKTDYIISYPTPEKNMIKQLEATSRYPDGVHYSVVSRICFPGKGPGQNIDIYKEAIGAGFVEFYRKEGRKHLYHITESGKELLEYAMQYKKVSELIDMLEKAENYPEFKMNIVFEAKAELATLEFFRESISPILDGTFLNSCHYPEVDHERVVRHMKNKLLKTRHWKEYVEDIQELVSKAGNA